MAGIDKIDFTHLGPLEAKMATNVGYGLVSPDAITPPDQIKLVNHPSNLQCGKCGYQYWVEPDYLAKVWKVHVQCGCYTVPAIYIMKMKFVTAEFECSEEDSLKAKVMEVTQAQEAKMAELKYKDYSLKITTPATAEVQRALQEHLQRRVDEAADRIANPIWLESPGPRQTR